MHPLPRCLQYAACFAVGSTVLLTSGCSHSDTDSSSDASHVIGSPTRSAKQDYLDKVDQLCDQLLPKVLKATQGGSLDIPAAQYLKNWPAHHRAEAAFDKSLAAVPVPPEAARASAAMSHYVAFADRLDARRLRAAKQGEAAWRDEVAAEKGVESAPAITARDAAGFAGSCDAR